MWGHLSSWKITFVLILHTDCVHHHHHYWEVSDWVPHHSHNHIKNYLSINLYLWVKLSHRRKLNVSNSLRIQGLHFNRPVKFNCFAGTEWRSYCFIFFKGNFSFFSLLWTFLGWSDLLEGGLGHEIFEWNMCVISGELGEGPWYHHSEQQWVDMWLQIWAHCLSCRVSEEQGPQNNMAEALLGVIMKPRVISSMHRCGRQYLFCRDLGIWCFPSMHFCACYSAKMCSIS